ncbi:MAG: hypothetical protein ACTSRR_02955 [Candidatus Heimdallarchaeaceae archaeon]
MKKNNNKNKYLTFLTIVLFLVSSLNGLDFVKAEKIDTSPPEFMKVYHFPQIPNQYEGVTVVATVKDETGIGEIYLIYFVDGVEYKKEMEYVFSPFNNDTRVETYAVSLGKYKPNTNVRYFIEVNDSTTNHNYAQSLMYDYTVVADGAPEIYIPPENIPDYFVIGGESKTINFNVYDEDGLEDDGSEKVDAVSKINNEIILEGRATKIGENNFTFTFSADKSKFNEGDTYELWFNATDSYGQEGESKHLYIPVIEDKPYLEEFRTIPYYPSIDENISISCRILYREDSYYSTVLPGADGPANGTDIHISAVYANFSINENTPFEQYIYNVPLVESTEQKYYFNGTTTQPIVYPGKATVSLLICYQIINYDSNGFINNTQAREESFTKEINVNDNREPEVLSAEYSSLTTKLGQEYDFSSLSNSSPLLSTEWEYTTVYTSSVGSHSIDDWYYENGTITINNDDWDYCILSSAVNHTYDDFDFNIEIKPTSDGMFGLIFKYRKTDGIPEYYLLAHTNSIVTLDQVGYSGAIQSVDKLQLFYVYNHTLTLLESVDWVRDNSLKYKLNGSIYNDLLKVSVLNGNSKILDLEKYSPLILNGKIGFYSGGINGLQLSNFKITPKVCVKETDEVSIKVAIQDNFKTVSATAYVYDDYLAGYQLLRDNTEYFQYYQYGDDGISFEELNSINLNLSNYGSIIYDGLRLSSSYFSYIQEIEEEGNSKLKLFLNNDLSEAWIEVITEKPVSLSKWNQLVINSRTDSGQNFRITGLYTEFNNSESIFWEYITEGYNSYCYNSSYNLNVDISTTQTTSCLYNFDVTKSIVNKFYIKIEPIGDVFHLNDTIIIDSIRLYQRGTNNNAYDKRLDHDFVYYYGSHQPVKVGVDLHYVIKVSDGRNYVSYEPKENNSILVIDGIEPKFDVAEIFGIDINDQNIRFTSAIHDTTNIFNVQVHYKIDRYNITDGTYYEFLSEQIADCYKDEITSVYYFDYNIENLLKYRDLITYWFTALDSYENLGISNSYTIFVEEYNKPNAIILSTFTSMEYNETATITVTVEDVDSGIAYVQFFWYLDTGEKFTYEYTNYDAVTPITNDTITTPSFGFFNHSGTLHYYVVVADWAGNVFSTSTQDVQLLDHVKPKIVEIENYDHTDTLFKIENEDEYKGQIVHFISTKKNGEVTFGIYDASNIHSVSLQYHHYEFTPYSYIEPDNGELSTVITNVDDDIAIIDWSKTHYDGYITYYTFIIPQASYWSNNDELRFTISASDVYGNYMTKVIPTTIRIRDITNPILTGGNLITNTDFETYPTGPYNATVTITVDEDTTPISAILYWKNGIDSGFVELIDSDLTDGVHTFSQTFTVETEGLGSVTTYYIECIDGAGNTEQFYYYGGQGSNALPNWYSVPDILENPKILKRANIQYEEYSIDLGNYKEFPVINSHFILNVSGTPRFFSWDFSSTSIDEYTKNALYDVNRLEYWDTFAVDFGGGAVNYDDTFNTWEKKLYPYLEPTSGLQRLWDGKLHLKYELNVTSENAPLFTSKPVHYLKIPLNLYHNFVDTIIDFDTKAIEKIQLWAVKPTNNVYPYTFNLSAPISLPENSYESVASGYYSHPGLIKMGLNGNFEYRDIIVEIVPRAEYNETSGLWSFVQDVDSKYNYYLDVYNIRNYGIFYSIDQSAHQDFDDFQNLYRFIHDKGTEDYTSSEIDQFLANVTEELSINPEITKWNYIAIKETKDTPESSRNRLLPCLYVDEAKHLRTFAYPENSSFDQTLPRRIALLFSLPTFVNFRNGYYNPLYFASKFSIDYKGSLMLQFYETNISDYQAYSGPQFEQPYLDLMSHYSESWFEPFPTNPLSIHYKLKEMVCDAYDVYYESLTPTEKSLIDSGNSTMPPMDYLSSITWSNSTLIDTDDKNRYSWMFITFDEFNHFEIKDMSFSALYGKIYDDFYKRTGDLLKPQYEWVDPSVPEYVYPELHERLYFDFVDFFIKPNNRQIINDYYFDTERNAPVIDIDLNDLVNLPEGLDFDIILNSSRTDYSTENYFLNELSSYYSTTVQDFKEQHNIWRELISETKISWVNNTEYFYNGTLIQTNIIIELLNDYNNLIHRSISVNPNTIDWYIFDNEKSVSTASSYSNLHYRISATKNVDNNGTGYILFQLPQYYEGWMKKSESPFSNNLSYSYSTRYNRHSYSTMLTTNYITLQTNDFEETNNIPYILSDRISDLVIDAELNYTTSTNISYIYVDEIYATSTNGTELLVFKYNESDDITLYSIKHYRTLLSIPLSWASDENYTYGEDNSQYYMMVKNFKIVFKINSTVVQSSYNFKVSFYDLRLDVDSSEIPRIIVVDDFSPPQIDCWIDYPRMPDSRNYIRADDTTWYFEIGLTDISGAELKSVKYYIYTQKYDHFDEKYIDSPILADLGIINEGYTFSITPSVTVNDFVLDENGHWIQTYVSYIAIEIKASDLSYYNNEQVKTIYFNVTDSVQPRLYTSYAYSDYLHGEPGSLGNEIPYDSALDEISVLVNDRNNISSVNLEINVDRFDISPDFELVSITDLHLELEVEGEPVKYYVSGSAYKKYKNSSVNIYELLKSKYNSIAPEHVQFRYIVKDVYGNSISSEYYDIYYDDTHGPEVTWLTLQGEAGGEPDPNVGNLVLTAKVRDAAYEDDVDSNNGNLTVYALIDLFVQETVWLWDDLNYFFVPSISLVGEGNTGSPGRYIFGDWATKIDLFLLECKAITIEEIDNGIYDHVLYYDITLIAGTNDEFIDYWDNSLGSRVDIPEGTGPDSVSEVKATDRFGNEGTVNSMNIVLADNRLEWSSTPQIISGHKLEGVENAIHGSHNLEVKLLNDPSSNLPFIEHYNGAFPVDLYKRVSVWTGEDWNEIINEVAYPNVIEGTECIFEVDHIGDSRINVGDKVKLEIFAKQTIEVDDGQGGIVYVDLYSKDPFELEFKITDKYAPEIANFHPESIPNFINGTNISFYVIEDIALLDTSNTIIGIWSDLSDFTTQQNELFPQLSITKVNNTHYFVETTVNASLWHEILDDNSKYAVHITIDDGVNILNTTIRKYITDAQGPSLSLFLNDPSSDSRYDFDTNIKILATDDNVIGENDVHFKYQDYTGLWSDWGVATFIQGIDNIYTFSFIIPKGSHPTPMILNIIVKASDINGYETITSKSFDLVDKRAPDYKTNIPTGVGILFNPIVAGANDIQEPYDPSIAITYQGKTHIVILATDISGINLCSSVVEIQFSTDGSNWGSIYSFSIGICADFDLDDYNSTGQWVERYWKAYDITIEASLFDSADFIVGNYIRIRPKIVDINDNVQTQYYYDTQIKDGSPSLLSVHLTNPVVTEGGEVDYYNPPKVTVDLSTPYTFEYITVYLRRSSDNVLFSSSTFDTFNPSTGLYEGDFPQLDLSNVGINFYIDVYVYCSILDGYDENTKNNNKLIINSVSGEGTNNPLSFLITEYLPPLADEIDAQIVVYQDTSQIKIPVYDDTTTLTSTNVVSIKYDDVSQPTQDMSYSGTVVGTEPHPTNSSWQMIVANIDGSIFNIGDKVALAITLQDNCGNTATYRLDNNDDINDDTGLGYRINQASPTVTITSSYSNNEINYASDIDITFSVQHEDGDYNTQYRYSIESGSYTEWTSATGSSGTYSFTIPKTEYRIDEYINIEVRASDETGTYFGTDSVSLHAVDKEPPYGMFFKDSNPDTEVKNIGEVLTFKCIIKDDITPSPYMNYQYRYKNENGDWTTWKTDGTLLGDNYYSITIPGQITTGTYIVEVKGTDEAGNSATYSFDYIVSDKTPPTIDFTPPNGVSNNEAYDLKISYFISDNYVNIEPSMVTFSYKENGEGTAHYRTVHSGSLEDEFYSYIDNAILNYEDTFSITITASDGINLVEITDSFTVSVDATNPSGSNPSVDDSTPVYGSTIELSINVFDDGGVSTLYTKYKCYYKHPGESSFTNYVYGTITTTPEDAKTPTFTLSNLKWYSGAWDVKFTYTDAHGHTGSYTWSDAFTVIDNIKPSVSKPVSSAGNTIDVGHSTYIRADFSDLSSLASGLDLAGTPPNRVCYIKHKDPSGNWVYHSISHYSGNTYQVYFVPDSSYSGKLIEWRAVAYDKAGNVQTSSAFYLQVNEVHYAPSIISVWAYGYNDRTMNDLFYARVHAKCSTDNINYVQIRYGPTTSSYTTTSSGISRYSGTARDGYWQKQLTGGDRIGERVYFKYRVRNDYGQYSSWSSWKYVEYKGLFGAMDLELKVEEIEFNESRKTLTVKFNKAFASENYRPFIILKVDQYTTRKLILTPLDEEGKTYILPLSSLIDSYEIDTLEYMFTIENLFGRIWSSEDYSLYISDLTKPKIVKVVYADYYSVGEQITINAKIVDKNIKEVKILFLSPIEKGWKVTKTKNMKEMLSSFFLIGFKAKNSPGYYIQIIARDKNLNEQVSEIYRIIVNQPSSQKYSLLLPLLVSGSLLLVTITLIIIKRPKLLLKAKFFLTSNWSTLSQTRGRKFSHFFKSFGGKK